MTDEDVKELMRDEVLPVILGNGIGAHMLSLDLLVKYGISSVLCGEKRNFLNLFDLKCGFLHFINDEDGRLCVEQLTDLFDDADGRIAVLVASDERWRGLMEQNAETLESRYILAYSREELYKLPLFDRCNRSYPTLKGDY